MLFDYVRIRSPKHAMNSLKLLPFSCKVSLVIHGHKTAYTVSEKTYQQLYEAHVFRPRDGAGRHREWAHQTIHHRD